MDNLVPTVNMVEGPTLEQVSHVTANETARRAHYSPPWADMSVVGIAGSSGSGKTSLSVEISKSLSLPWVIILSMVRASRDVFTERVNN